MTASKSERLTNLVIMLLVARTFVTKEQIRATISGYADSSEVAFNRMFERDKEELRALGVPIESGFVDKFFEDEIGYRISRDDYELPEIQLEADEAAVLGLAADMWRNANAAQDTRRALVKLGSSGLDIDLAGADVVAPQLVADEPAFEAMWQATTTRTPVTFAYQRSGKAEAEQRRLQPWGVVTYRQRWYVVGWDLEREEERMFRLSRVAGAVTHAGEAGSYERPIDLDMRALTSVLQHDQAEQTAVIDVRPGEGLDLRRRATSVTSGAERDRLEVNYRSEASLRAAVLAAGSSAVVVSPDSLRDAVLAALRELTAPTASGGVQ